MNSLKFKILGLITAILVIVVALTVWHNIGVQKTILHKFAEQNGRVLVETIRNSISAHMSIGQNDEVAGILQKISREPAIKTVRIFDESGRILRSGNPQEVGTLVENHELIALRSNRLSYLNPNTTYDSHNTLAPIYNAPACFRCHDPQNKTLGVLSVHLSLSMLSKIQEDAQITTLTSSIVGFGILILLISSFILVYVDTPIRKLVEAMTHVENGEFDNIRADISNSKEMALLSSKFNLMVERLQLLISTKVKHEREIAVAQEKLHHHEEIQNMNATLEARLKEIEYLNITLEERIEEIEEANYKIADLASELEARNVTLGNTVERLSTLNKIGLGLNSVMDPERLYNLVVRNSRETLKAQVGYLLLRKDDDEHLHLACCQGINPAPDDHMKIALRPGGVSHWVIEKREPVLIENINASQQFSKFSLMGFNRQSVVCAPLFVNNRVAGTLTIANKHDGSGFNPGDLELLSTIAAQASVAISNGLLYQEQQATYLGTVQALVSTIEANDKYTRGHSERVTRLSLLLAQEMDLSPQTLIQLEQAAILHDIGKIGISASLLHKKGKLTDEDIRTLQEHPSIGVRILTPIEFLSGVSSIIIQHHERYDGKGYPHGLRGTAISLEARILAVADTYDAMTSNRPYRNALSPETALKEIIDNTGTQFDPDVARVFVKLHPKLGLPSNQLLASAE